MVALIFLFVNLAASLFKSKSRLEACRNERRKFSALLKMLRAGMREQQATSTAVGRRAAPMMLAEEDWARSWPSSSGRRPPSR